jgi:hypothetical protein
LIKNSVIYFGIYRGKLHGNWKKVGIWEVCMDRLSGKRGEN